jgi:hypothetical protein
MSQFSIFVSKGSLGVINLGLHPTSDETMRSLLGHPKGTLTADDCQDDLASDTVQRLKETRNFGHFSAMGIKPALDSLQKIFDAVREDNPQLFDAVGSAGMLCVRLRRPTSGAPSTQASNHAWGTAIDITIDGIADTTADERVQLGIAKLIPFFNDEGWFSGVGFASSEDDTHFEVADETIQAWAARGLFDPPDLGLEPVPVQSGLVSQALQERVIQIAARSAIARFNWPGRSVAPAGFIKGMAVVYAQTYAKLRAGDPAAKEMAKADSGDAGHDVLAWYAPEFAAEGMRNDTDGPDTLRHLFVLMIGLGMRESSGKYCCGRDTSASNTDADTAEAGLFQTSYNAKDASPILLGNIFKAYRANPNGFVEIFKECPACTAGDLENFGGGDGEEFQNLSKTCPAFAAEFTAVALRHARTHWGPINTRAVEIRPECDAMLKDVQAAVDGVPIA